MEPVIPYAPPLAVSQPLGILATVDSDDAVLGRTVQGLSPAVPCLFPACYEKVRFDLGSANGNGSTPRAHARCPNGHPHYAEDLVRYGTDRER